MPFFCRKFSGDYATCFSSHPPLLSSLLVQNYSQLFSASHWSESDHQKKKPHFVLLVRGPTRGDQQLATFQILPRGVGWWLIPSEGCHCILGKTFPHRNSTALFQLANRFSSPVVGSWVFFYFETFYTLTLFHFFLPPWELSHFHSITSSSTRARSDDTRAKIFFTTEKLRTNH